MTAWSSLPLAVRIAIVLVAGTLGSAVSCGVCVGLARYAARDDGPAPPAPARARASKGGARQILGEISIEDAQARASRACDQLTKVGVAYGCKSRATIGDIDPVEWGMTTFSVRGGFAGDDGIISCHRTTAGYTGDVTPAKPADDFPDLPVRSPVTRLVIVIGSDLDKHPWGACIESRKSVAVCASKFPRQYAAYRAYYEAARRVVDER